jgi:ribosome biogenesis GTPase
LIRSYGWSDALQRDFQSFADQGLTPARVIIQRRGAYQIVGDAGEAEARITGRLAHEATEGGYPVTGDWVAAELDPSGGLAMIHAVLPRASVFTRRAAGESGAIQVVAANIDVAFVTASLNADLNPRRLERYLAMAHESGARPVIVLTKADVCDDVAALVAEVTAAAAGVRVLAISSRTGQGLEALRAEMTPGTTAVLLGSSGVGKSTLVNALAGREKMATREIREDDARGRHTTTHRELVLLPSGALILDTPGMRELGLADAEAGLAAAFADFQGEVDGLAEDCRFRDCAHGAEPGCAVRAALEDGRLDRDRWESFGKLRRELAHEARKEDPRARSQARKVFISRTKGVRAILTQRRRERDD